MELTFEKKQVDEFVKIITNAIKNGDAKEFMSTLMTKNQAAFKGI